MNKFSLTPRRIPVERKASADKSRVDLDMVASEESGSEAESGWSGVSDNSSTDSECSNLEASSVASDQDRFDTAYEAFRDLAEGLYSIDLTRYSRGVTSEDAPGVQLLHGQEKLQELVHLPRTWPLARLTIPLAGLSKHIDRLLEGSCFQILATNRDPEAHNGKVIQTATHPTWILAEYLAYYCVAHAEHSGPCLQDLIRQRHSTTLDTEFLDPAALSGTAEQRRSHSTERFFRKSSWLHRFGQDHL